MAEEGAQQHLHVRAEIHGHVPPLLPRVDFPEAIAAPGREGFEARALRAAPQSVAATGNPAGPILEVEHDETIPLKRRDGVVR